MEEKDKKEGRHIIHTVLAHSYFSYFLSFLLGVIFDFFFPVTIFDKNTVSFFGIAFILLGTVFIFWAQKTSRKLKKDTNTGPHYFLRGPYKFLRSPTHGGLVSLLLGFGCLVNGTFIIIFTLVAAIFTKFTFLRKEESLLEEKYGEDYRLYKERVKL